MPLLANKIKQKAYELGFELAGICTPAQPAHYHTYKSWIEQNRHASMHYLGNERALHMRAHPNHLMPECRSILVLGKIYLPAAHENLHTGSLKVAAYAAGDDYHDILPERLRELMHALESWVDQPICHRIYTDTGPLLERDLAMQAGLGWIGKNTCLIHPGIGSYFFLAEILLDLDLPADPPFTADHCGTCRRCIDACPTSAIRNDRTLDAGRCLSYLSIELKETIPVEFLSSFEDWAFGCDICQLVCPWNARFACPTIDSAFQIRPALEQRDLDLWLQMDNARFQHAFRGSPIKRSKRRGLLRNTLINAAHQRGTDMIPALLDSLLHEPEALLRTQSAMLLGNLLPDNQRGILEQARCQETDASVVRALDAAIANLTP